MDYVINFEISFYSNYLYELSCIQNYLNDFNKLNNNVIKNIGVIFEYLQNIIKYTFIFNVKSDFVDKNIKLSNIKIIKQKKSCFEFVYLINLNEICNPIKIEDFTKVFNDLLKFFKVEKGIIT